MAERVRDLSPTEIELVPLSKSEGPSEEDLRLMLTVSGQYTDLFTYLGRSPNFRQNIFRSRNAQVEDSRVWSECEPIVQNILEEASTLIPGGYNPNPEDVRKLFLLERKRFVNTSLDVKGSRSEVIGRDYKLDKDKIFNTVKDKAEARRLEVIAEVLFQQGFFRK